MISKFFISLVILVSLSSCSLLLAKKEPGQSCAPAGCEEQVSKRPQAAPTIAVVHPTPVRSKTEIEALEELARTNPKAAYDLALKYFRDDGVAQNSTASMSWMRYSAERGLLQAQKALGLIYLTGLKEVKADPAEAERWLKIAAASGDEESAAMVMEAKRAMRANKEKWKNEQYWRKNAQRYWFRDYPYLGRWEKNRWVY